MVPATSSADNASVSQGSPGSFAWSLARLGHLVGDAWGSVIVRTMPSASMSTGSADVLVDGEDATVGSLVH